MKIKIKKGFPELLMVCGRMQNKQNITAAALLADLQSTGMTVGAATGTIRRAWRAGLLRRKAYGVYQYAAPMLMV